MGSTRAQVLLKVQLPLARRMLLLAVNQTILFALSMVVIAGLIGGPGLGEVVTSGIYSNPALAILAGAAIVIMAIALDRATESMAEHTDPSHRHVTEAVRRRLHLETLAAVATVGLVGRSRVRLRRRRRLLRADGAGVAAHADPVGARLRPESRGRRLLHLVADRQLHRAVRPRAAEQLLLQHAVVRDAARADGDRLRRERPAPGYHDVRDARLDRSDGRMGTRDVHRLAGARGDGPRGRTRVHPRRVGGREPHRGADPASDQRRPADAAAARLHHPVHLPDAGLDRARDHRGGAVRDSGRDPARLDGRPRRASRTPSRRRAPSAPPGCRCSRR